MPLSLLACGSGGMQINTASPSCRKLFNPRTQVSREHKCAATALHGAQLAGPDRCVQSCPAGACDRARFGDAESKL